MKKSFNFSALCFPLFLLLATLLTRTVSGEGVKKLERYLILPGCTEAKPSGFWLTLKNGLESSIQFDSISCIGSSTEEFTQTQNILQRKLEDPSRDIQVVAAILPSGHCIDESDCKVSNLGENYIPLLQAGVAGWFIESEPNFEALGVDRTGFDCTELFPDNALGGRLVGQEFCRTAESIAPATIAVLYGSADAAHSTARIENFIAALDQFCPEAEHKVKYSFYADWSAKKAAAILSPVFLRDGSVNAVIAANDDMALGALIANRELRPNVPLLVGGYDFNNYIRPLLKSGDVFASIEQGSGIVSTLALLLSEKASGIDVFGPPSVCSQSPSENCGIDDYNEIQAHTWKQVSAAIPEKMSTPVSIQVKDPVQLVLRELLRLYNPAMPPLPETSKVDSNATLAESSNALANPPSLPVLAKLRDFQIYGLDSVEQTISGKGLLVLSWKDTRLAWSIEEYPGVENINVPIDLIWSPSVILGNLVQSGLAFPLTSLQATVYPDGSVVWEQTINAGDFRCGSIDDTLFSFPFDSHTCGLDISTTSSGGFTLAPTLDEDIDEVFNLEITDTDWLQGESLVFKGSSIAASVETYRFNVEMTRDRLYVELSYVIPSYLLNIISFSQFWIPSRGGTSNLDRGGMAITTILSALALRESMSTEVGTTFTLLDLFMLVSLIAHFIGFIITAYESSYVREKAGENEDGIGSVDRAGKFILPVVFGLFNLVLSVLWAHKAWTLTYLSLIQIVISLILTKRSRKLIARLFKGCSETQRNDTAREKPYDC